MAAQAPPAAGAPAAGVAPPPQPVPSVEVFRSKRGGVKALCEGYSYRLARYHKDGTAVFRCDREDTAGCKARAEATMVGDTITAFTMKKEHEGHLAEPERALREQIRSRVREQAKSQPAAALVRVVSESLEAIPKDDYPISPDQHCLKKVGWLARRTDVKRRKTAGALDVACYKTLGSMVIDPAFLLCGDDNFLVHDSGSADGGERFMIFGAAKNVEELKAASAWVCDGTFKQSPRLFTQLYTILAYKKGFALPLLFALLPDKRKQTYQRLWRAVAGIADIHAKEDAPTVLLDFECGSFSALGEQFGDHNLGGCLFHYCQCIRRKVHDLGFSPRYATDASFRVRVKCLCAMPHVPLASVVPVFEELFLLFQPDEEKLMKYYVHTWIGEPIKLRIADKDARDLRKRPLFAHDLWNVNDRVWEPHHTTSNAAERWHSKYNKCLPHGSAHPSMEAFLDGLHAAQRLTDLDLAKIAVGSQQRETQHRKAKRERIMTLLEDFDEDKEGLKLLRAIAYLAD